MTPARPAPTIGAVSDRVRVALTLAVLSVEFALLLNTATSGRAAEWVIYRTRAMRVRLARPVLLEQQARREAGGVVWEAMEITRKAAENDND